jgi:hypothetical protein
MTTPSGGPISRFEVITSVQRRRRWSAAEKVRLVEEAMQPGMSVSFDERTLHALLRVAEGADMPVEGVGHIGMRQARDAQALALAFPALLLGIVDPQRIVAVKGDDRARALCGKVRGDPVFGGFRHGRTAMFMPHGCSGRELGYDRRR